MNNTGEKTNKIYTLDNIKVIKAIKKTAERKAENRPYRQSKKQKIKTPPPKKRQETQKETPKGGDQTLNP